VDSKIDAREKEKAAAKDKINLGTILMTQADGKDKFLITLSFIMAFITGAGLPSFTFLYGNIINAFGSDSADSMIDEISKLALILTVIGAIIWLTTYIYFVCGMILSERIGRKTKVAYLRAILN
jgi:ATP-binding cassette subfamily B (MDR/TAP) protein 1